MSGQSRKLMDWNADGSPAGNAREMEPAIATHIQPGAFHGGWNFVHNPERMVKTIAEQMVRDGGEIVADDVVRIEVSEGLPKST